jgi:hypothetical protein
VRSARRSIPTSLSSAKCPAPRFFAARDALPARRCSRSPIFLASSCYVSEWNVRSRATKGNNLSLCFSPPESSGLRRLTMTVITLGICDRRNGVQGSVCTAAIPSRRCLLWVKSRHDTLKSPCPLYPQKRTLRGDNSMSALCQKRTRAVQQPMTVIRSLRRQSQGCPAGLSGQMPSLLRD